MVPCCTLNCKLCPNGPDGALIAPYINIMALGCLPYIDIMALGCLIWCFNTFQSIHQ